MNAGLETFYRVIRKFVNLQTISAPSLDALFPSQSPPFIETSIITRSTLYPFRNVAELRLNGVYLNQREGKVTPVDLIRCLLDFPHLKTLFAHIQIDNGSVHPLMYPPTEAHCALRHLELTVARTSGQLMDSLAQFLQLTKNLETFELADRTMRKNMRGFDNSFIFQRGAFASELDIIRVVEALSGSHKTLVRLVITQYDPFLPEARAAVPIS
ncbi:12362_t:CDS:1, partial [Acaulospora colombiana]